MHFFNSLITFALPLGLVSAAPKTCATKRSPAPALVDGKYVLNERTTFANSAVYTFDGTSLPSGLVASDYALSSHSFTPSNVNLVDGYLELLVNGGQTVMPYTCGEVTTSFSNILYASVRTTAILTDPAGVCNGMFFYKNDNQESDIEWLSDANSLSNQGTRYLWLTNQATTVGGTATDNAVTPPSNPTTTEHEYRLDWTEGLVQWYVDGVLVWETTENVPSEAGPWVWNNWSNGDDGWSAGPPAVDAIFKIKEIEMYYNTA